MKLLIHLCIVLISAQSFANTTAPFGNIFAPPPAAKLPHLGADKATVTVSGLSSGAFMAVQMGVAYSDQIFGVSSVAGGIYNCALGNTSTATDLCMKTPDKIDVSAYVKNVDESFQKGRIADPKNIASQKVFILNGAADSVVLPVAGKKLAEFYQAFGVQAVVDFDLKMGHAFPSDLGKNSCEKSQFPWVNKCEYEGAEKIFTAMYGPMNRPASEPAPKAVTGELVKFDQQEFKAKEAKMLDYGHVYIPKDCKVADSQCRLHIAFHGCMQSPNIIQEQFVVGANYNAWADVNKIIVLYPATTMGAGNSTGCWDWLGYTGTDYAVKKSLQMTAVMKMVEALTAQ